MRKESADLFRSLEHRPLRGLISDQLKELIISGQVLPGERLVEADMAERLGTSRVPVREALLELARDGWVELRARHGARVHSPTAREAEELFQVRSVLEAETARLAAEAIDDTGIATLREICIRGMSFVDADDHTAAARANAEFHRAVAEHSGNQVLARIFANIEDRFRWYFTRIAPARGMSSWVEHERIVAALADHDPVRAEAEMRDHAAHTREIYRSKFSATEQGA